MHASNQVAVSLGSRNDLAAVSFPANDPISTIIFSLLEFKKAIETFNGSKTLDNYRKLCWQQRDAFQLIYSNYPEINNSPSRQRISRQLLAVFINSCREKNPHLNFKFTEDELYNDGLLKLGDYMTQFRIRFELAHSLKVRGIEATREEIKRYTLSLLQVPQVTHIKGRFKELAQGS